jgi:hypothetical protein
MKIVFSLILLFVAITAYSQVNDQSDIIIDPIEQMPNFPGGLDSLWCFLENNFKYEILNKNTESTKYIIKFYIDTLGRAKGFDLVTTIPRDSKIDTTIQSEIFRVMSLMPNWEPASQMGKKVTCWFTIPITTPCTVFKCEKLQYLKDVEFRPDSSAKFSVGVERTNEERINNYLINNLKWPSEEEECSGKVIIRCVVEKTGELSNFEYILRLCPDYDKEALRVIKEMPKWIPAIKDNQPVRSIIVIVIKYKILF